MNLPNKLTILRMIAVIPTVLLLLLGKSSGAGIAAGVLFILASVTDMLDGLIARRRNLITNFGKFMDPLADKLLVTAVLVCLVSLGRVPVWAVLIVLGREFAMTGFRMIAAEKQMVISASRLGKRKANFQTFWLIALLFPFDWTPWQILTQVLMWIALALTVGSFVEYLLKNPGILKE